MWQVVDQVATYELGGAKHEPALPHAGDLRHDHHRLARQQRQQDQPHHHGAPLIDIDAGPQPADRRSSTRRPRNPTDYDLVNACELWLADTATSDSEIERAGGEPREYAGR